MLTVISEAYHLIRHIAKELVMFELEDIDKLPHIINDLVTDKYKMQKIADEGRKKALQFHSWEKRADELYYDLISQL